MKSHFVFQSAAALLIAGTSWFGAAARADIATFDDLPSLAAESHWNGSDMSGTLEVVADPWYPPDGTMDVYHGGFYSGGAYFNNNYNATYWSWDGWAYSNMTDTTTAGWLNQYSAITGGGFGGSSNYGVAYTGSSTAMMSFSGAVQVQGAYITNTTYVCLDMLQGSQFSKKFGGESGDDPDWFLLTIVGKDVGGATTGSVDFYLADYRFENSDDDHIVDDWTLVDLTVLGDNVKCLEFTLDSSDHFIDGGFDYGMNTPAYFAMDNLTVVPEPSTLVLLIVGFLATLAWRWRRQM